MQSAVRETVTEKKYKTVIRTGVKYLLPALAGFLLSGVGLEEEIYPFGIAFCGGISYEYLPGACLGTALGAFVFTNGGVTLKYTGAVMLVFILRTGLQKKIKESRRLWLYPVFTFFSLLIASLGIMLTGKPTAADGILMGCDVCIAGAGAGFSYRVCTLLTQKVKPVGVTGVDMISLNLAGTLLLAGLSRFQPFGFCPARVVGFFVVMLLCLYGKAGAGAVAGICTGLVFGLGDEMPHLMFSLPLAGVIGEACRESGALTTAVGFVCCTALSLILKGNPDTALIACLEGGFAAGVFVLLPQKIKLYGMKRLSFFSPADETGSYRRYLSLLLKRRAVALRKVGTSLEKVSRFVVKNKVPVPDKISGDVRDDICITCEKYACCWENYAGKTERDFEETKAYVLENDSIAPSKLPKHLKEICLKPQKICESFERFYCEYRARLWATEEIKSAKQVAVSRFLTLADILDDTVCVVRNDDMEQTPIGPVAAGIFRTMELPVVFMTALSDEEGHIRIEALCRNLPKSVNYDTVILELAEKTNIIFSPPVEELLSENETLLLFYEAPLFRVEFYQVSRMGPGERYCGDSCEGFYDGRGNFFCILSDGMGTGTPAALDSLMTCSLMGRLIKAGLSMQAAFDCVNAALMVKSAEETLATLDILKINLYSGRTEFYKAGGCFSVLRKKNRTVIAEKASMPLGILREAGFQCTETQLDAGDAVLMLSDGAADLSPSFFKNMFGKNKNGTAEHFCRSVIKAAEEGENPDDITAACVILHNLHQTYRESG